VNRLPEPALGVDVPSEVIVAAQEARARAAAGVPGSTTRTRVRTRSGLWLLIHASCLQAADGTAGDAAVVIEPAKASEVAPLIVEAYELTPREVDVTRALARGLTTNEIAGELHLSRYTVQDHLKSVYEKAGVSSRGELVAKMFADHYHDVVAGALHRAAAAA
jgi:DNA-binding NarL/FixJ family response regulator